MGNGFITMGTQLFLNRENRSLKSLGRNAIFETLC